MKTVDFRKCMWKSERSDEDKRPDAPVNSLKCITMLAATG